MAIHELDDGEEMLDPMTGDPITDEAHRFHIFSEIAEAPMKTLRLERNHRLAETDWMANSDVTMSAEWSAYRQALRDITDTYSSPNDVVWPTKPE